MVVLAVDQKKKTIHHVLVGEDGKTARLYVPELREGYVYEVRANGVRSAKKQGLLHPVAYYTLNNIPEGQKLEMAVGGGCCRRKC